MRPFVENLPFLCIFLAILTGIVSAVIPRGRVCYWMTVTVAGIIAVLSAVVLQYTYGGNLSFTYSMGRFAAPYGNAIQCGPLQALLAMVFSVVLALALAGRQAGSFPRCIAGQAAAVLHHGEPCWRHRCWPWSTPTTFLPDMCSSRSAPSPPVHW